MRVTLLLVVIFGGVLPAAWGATGEIARVRALYDSANAMYRAKQYDSAIAVYHTVADRARALPDDSVWTIIRDAHYNAGCCFALTARPFDALVALDSAMQHGFWDVDFMSTDRDLRALHGDVRFDSLRLYIRQLKKVYTAKVRAAPTPVRLPHDTLHVRTAPLLVALHGASSFPTASLKYWEKTADSLGCVLVAPYGLFVRSPRELSFGLNADSVDAAVQDAIANIGRWLGGTPRRIILAGTGEGAAVAYALGLKHPEIFSGILAVNGYYNAAALAKFIPDAQRRGLCVAAVYDSMGTSIPTSNIRAEDALRRAGIETRMLRTRGAEIEPDQAILMSELHWLLDD